MFISETRKVRTGLILIVIIFGTLSACAAASNNTDSPAAVHSESSEMLAPESFEMPAAPWSIVFADGSANTFRFWQESATEPARFEYDPVEMAESSSGTYSGGTAKAGELSAADVVAIWTHVDALRCNENVHAQSRMMGTGRFTVKTGDMDRQFMLQAGPALQEFMSIIEPFADRQ